MDEPKRFPLATVVVAALDVILYLTLGLIALFLTSAIHASSWLTENPILATFLGTLGGAVAVIAIIRRTNRRDDPRQQKSPPDDP